MHSSLPQRVAKANGNLRVQDKLHFQGSTGLLTCDKKYIEHRPEDLCHIIRKVQFVLHPCGYGSLRFLHERQYHVPRRDRIRGRDFL